MKVPQRPPEASDLVADLPRQARLLELLAEVKPVDPKGRYLHWDEMRNRTPPMGLTHHEWWLGTALSRRSIARSLPLVGTDGQRFQLCNVDQIQELVHRIDQQASGQILSDGLMTGLRSSDRYLVSSLVEEAITSSQLEGATTTRLVAKELLATGRPPRDRSEQMIVNNFQAMVYAQDLASEALTPSAILDLHRLVTEDTLDEPAGAGRFQTADEDRIAVYWQDTLLHRPPPAEDLEGRAAALCRFANGEATDGFVHPVVRAIIVHFWLAYDHPFVDGNGRTARALFYWSLLHQGYWLAQYLSVSSILAKAPVKYARSYLYTETDHNDLTYFVIYQLQVIVRAIESLHAYLGRKFAEVEEVQRLIHGTAHLNNRQIVVAQDALSDPSEPFTIGAQARRHRVTYETARSDLTGMERMGLLAKSKVGKKFVFRSVPDLTDRLRRLAGTSADGR